MKKVSLLLAECGQGSDKVKVIVDPTNLDDIDLAVLSGFIGETAYKKVDLASRNLQTRVGAVLAGFEELCYRLGFEPVWVNDPSEAALMSALSEARRKDRFSWIDMRFGAPVFRSR